VDNTGSSTPTAGLNFDGGALEVKEQNSVELSISADAGVRAYFTQTAEGNAATGCENYFDVAESAASLKEACDLRLTEEECSVSFNASGVYDSRYAVQLPALRRSIALNYDVTTEDRNGVVDSRRLELCVQAVNTAPEAIDHTYEVEYGGTLEASDATFDPFNCELQSGSGVLKGSYDDFDLESMDPDSETPCLSAELVDQPTQASAFELNPLGGFVYTPTGGLTPGSKDSFTYAAFDGSLSSETRTVFIEVIGDNASPVLIDNPLLIVDENGSDSIDVSALAVDPEGKLLTLSSVGTPTSGTTSQNEEGTALIYFPNANFTGSDSVDFSVQDPAGAVVSGTLAIQVALINKPPTIEAPTTFNLDFNNGFPSLRTFDITVDDRETNPAILRLSAVSSAPEVATVRAPNAIANNGSASISVNAIKNGVTEITLTVTDQGLGEGLSREAKSTTATVLVTVSGINTNRAPQASDVSRSVVQGGTLIIDLDDSTFDPDGDTLSYTLVGAPRGVTRTGSTVRFSALATANPDTLAFNYTVRDGSDSDTGRITVVVSAIPNIAPVASDANRSIQVGETLVIDLADLSNDADGDDLSYALVNAPTNATLVNSSELRFTPSAVGTQVINYTVSDDEDSDTGRITIVVTAIPNNAPVATNARETIQEGEIATFDLRDLVTDADGDALSFDLVNEPTNASLSGNTLTVTTSTFGTTNVTYRVDDGSDTDTGVVTVVATEKPNTPPTTRNVSRSITAGETTTIDLSSISADSDGDVLEYSLVGTTSGVSIEGSIITVATETTDPSNTLAINFVVDDGEATATGTVTIEVTALVINRPPSAADANLKVVPGDAVELDLTFLTSDPDAGDTLSYTLIAPPEGASLDAPTLTYLAPADAEVGTAVEVEYQVNDGIDTASGTVTITIEAAAEDIEEV